MLSIFVPGAAFAQSSARDSDQVSRPVWLGIQLTTVPAPLASHLRLEDVGLMVRNVFIGSPADKAGIQQYDVIIEVDGRKVTGDVETFIANLRDRKPGDQIELVLYRKGEKMKVNFELAERPGGKAEFKPKYDIVPEDSPYEGFDLRGRILRPGPDGWILEDLGPIPHFREMPRYLRQYMRELVEGDAAAGGIEEGRRVDKQGQVLHVLKKKDGSVEVKRYKQTEGESRAETKNYPNKEELQKADRQAYELLESAAQERKALEGDKPQNENLWQPWLRKQGTNWRDWAERKWESIPQEEWRDRWGEWRDRFFQGPLRQFKDEKAEPGNQNDTAAAVPDVRFETQPDGRITVHLRDQGAELSRTYESEQALRQAAPDLHRKYEALQKKLR